MSEVNLSALIALGVLVVGLMNGWIAYLASKTKNQVAEVKAHVEVNTKETSETKEKVQKLSEAVNGPLTAALETIRNYARERYEDKGGEGNRQKLINAEEALKTHEEGKRT